jgi:hypothetical protein
MTKGVREFAVSTFNSTLPQRAELGDTKFRAEVMNLIIMTFGVSVSSASTHYNFAKTEAEKNTPELVKGLGRAADKKGGRKPIHVVDVVKVRNGEVVATGLSRAAAEKLIQAAVDGGKAKLKIKEVEAVAPVAAEATLAVETALNVDALAGAEDAVATDAAPEAPAEDAVAA